MARDLILGRTRRNWARGEGCGPRALLVTTTVSDEVTLRLTPAEMSMLADLSATKMRADAGDRKAKSKMARVSKNLTSFRARAKRGDKEAQRTLLVLQESGVFRGVQSMTLGGEQPLGTVSNVDYRVAVLRQAVRAAKKAKRKKPTTLDFYKAKTAVDGAMRDAGLSLYLPRARPSRQTL